MKFVFFSIVLAAVLLDVTSATTCMTCASSRLNPTTGGVSWSVTGLSNPSAIPKDNFFDTCGTAQTTNTVKASWVLTCDSYCISMYVTDIAMAKQNGQHNTDDPTYRLYVRGCATTLLDYTPSAAQTPTDKSCAYGPRKFYDQDGQLSTGYQYIYQCSTTANVLLGCNFQSLTPATTDVGAMQTTCAQNVKNTAKCEQCQSNSENCNSGGSACTTGEWCLKTVTNMNNDVYTTTKSCTPINVRVTEGCRSWSETKYQQTRSLQSSSVTQCFCNGENCNGAASLTAMILAPVFALFLTFGWAS